MATLTIMAGFSAGLIGADVGESCLVKFVKGRPNTHDMSQGTSRTASGKRTPEEKITV
ncbi:hypothetical protein [Jeotgalibacillus soli]|uniref:hypothetical protein n=1 Tax=Jeotgalibacillus soli TaxID=889306 RepID=UPI0013BEA32B|nr:hypothetical protein [Jeotgalibacillus soli]